MKEEEIIVRGERFRPMLDRAAKEGRAFVGILWCCKPNGGSEAFIGEPCARRADAIRSLRRKIKENPRWAR